jgi:hypothetical protein
MMMTMIFGWQDRRSYVAPLLYLPRDLRQPLCHVSQENTSQIK